MQLRKRRGFALAILCAVVVVVGVGGCSGTTSEEVERSMSTVEQATPKDPCWFMTLRDKSIPYSVIKEREDRELHGYPKDIRLSEAIRVFNEEKQCNGLLAPFPPLTEDEVIAAIVAGPDHGNRGEVWRAQKDAFWKIAADRLMPKGSLLVAEAGYRIQDSPLRPQGTIEAKGIRISLLLGLEAMEHGSLLRPEQTLVIRKTYTRIEVIR